MRRLWAFTSAVLVSVGTMTAAVTGSAAAGQVTAPYQATDLGGLGGTWTIPSAINNRDEVVGASATAGSVAHPFLWRAGAIADLGILPGSAEGWGVAQDVNDLGQVVGTTDAGAFFWEHGIMTPLLGPSVVLSSATAINNLGQIVGSYFPPAGGASHGYLWQRGKVTDLGELDPVDVNDRGEVLARGYLEEYPYQAFIWRQGRLTNVDAGSPVAINNRGWVTGLASGDGLRAVLWRAGTTVQLGSLGGTDDSPTAINDRGQVLGTSRTANGELHGVMWQDGRTIDLSTRGIVLETVTGQAVPGSLTGVNDRGHLVGDLALPPDWSGPAVLFR